MNHWDLRLDLMTLKRVDRSISNLEDPANGHIGTSLYASALVDDPQYPNCIVPNDDYNILPAFSSTSGTRPTGTPSVEAYEASWTLPMENPGGNYHSMITATDYADVVASPEKEDSLDLCNWLFIWMTLGDK